MYTNDLQIVADFYSDPDTVRRNALLKEFNITGNYPGARTQPEPYQQSQYLKKFFENNIIHKPITYWPEEYNTAFQYTTETNTTWVHHDDTEYAGVLYLTPNAPVESGTGIYKHKQSGIYRHEEGAFDYNDSSEDAENLDRWEQIAFVGNIYNRLVVYRGDLYHRSVLPGFGTNKHNGRLFQTFFFST